MPRRHDAPGASVVAWTIAQAACARSQTAEQALASFADLLESDAWVMGYVMGGFQAVEQIRGGVRDDVSEFAAIVVAFTSEFDLAIERAGDLLNLDRIDRLQRDPVYLEGMQAGGEEAFEFLTKAAQGSFELPRDVPRRLFVHLAPDRCIEHEGSLYPDLEAMSMLPQLAGAHAASRQESASGPRTPDVVRPPATSESENRPLRSATRATAEEAQLEEASAQLEAPDVDQATSRRSPWRYLGMVGVGLVVLYASVLFFEASGSDRLLSEADSVGDAEAPAIETSGEERP